MLDTLITNKTRVKLLLRFFLNPGTSSYLRGLEEEFGESTNAIRLELNRFEAAGLLLSWDDKNKKMFGANPQHPLFGDICSILRKHAGVEAIVDQVINKLGHVQSAYIDCMEGLDHPSLDLVIFGAPIDQKYLKTLTKKASVIINREIHCTNFPVVEEKKFLHEHGGALLIWKNLKPLT